MGQHTIADKRPLLLRKFSEAFKRQIVKEFEQGYLSKAQLHDKYNLKGHATILKWCRKYGRFAYPQNSTIGRPKKDPQKQKIKELEKKLKEAQEKLIIYDKLIESTSRQMGEDVKKKIEA